MKWDCSGGRVRTSGKPKMRQRINRVSFVFGMVFLVSCASAIPPSRIGEYVSSEYKTFDDAFRRINQRPLQTGLVVVSEMAEPAAAPNLPDEALARLGRAYNRGSRVRFLW
jgi:hypothetical protein